MNQSAFDVSRQCDIIVYDGLNHPPVFRDGDFVVVRPESIRSIIEVKSVGSRREIADTLESFLDFAMKWQTTQRFYKDHSQARSTNPQLHCFCWSAPPLKRKNVGQSIREQIALFYKSRLSLEQFGAFPLLSSLMVYNEWEISEVQGVGGESEESRYQLGWHSRRGRFIKVKSDNSLYLDTDRTIASLLSKLHWATEKDKFNRFFSYLDEVKSMTDNELNKGGVTWAWQTGEVDPIRRQNSGELPI